MDFSQRQIRRSAPLFQFGSVPPPDVPRPTQEMGKPQRLLLAAAAAYLIVASVPPPDAPSAFGNQEFRPREIQRAPSAAYWQFGRNPPEDVPETFGFQDHKPRPLPRAANDAYWRINGTPPPNFSEDTLIEPRLALPHRLLYAGAAAYEIFAKVPPDDAPAAFGYQDSQPRQPLRAQPDSYAVNARFVNPDEINANNGHQTHAVRPARLAPSSAYWLDQRPTAQFDSGIPASQGVQDHTPRQAPRATRQAYFIDQRPIWLEPGDPAAHGFVDSHPRQLPRAGKTAYEFINRIPSDQQPVAWGHQTAQARAEQRANAAAYWVDHVALIQGPDKPASDGQQANNVRSVARAANDAYRLIVPMVRDEPETSSGYVEQRPLVQQRARPSAYWLEQRSAIYEPDRPTAFGHVSERAPAAKRAATSAYGILHGVPAVEVPAAKGYVETASLPARRAQPQAYFVSLPLKAIEESIPAQFGHQTHAAKPTQRAANAAYAIAVSFATPEPQSPGSVVLPAVRSAQRAANAAYQWEIFGQTDERMPAGRGHITERARQAQRAEQTAYQQQRGVQPSEDNLVQPQLDQQPRLPQRAAKAAYWIDDTTHVRNLDIPAGRGWLTERAPAAKRAIQEAYKASLAQPQQADFALPAFGYQQDRTRSASRAPASAYLVANAPIPAVPPTPGQPLLPGRAVAPRRAPQPAYAGLLSPMALQEPCAFGFQAIPVQPGRAAKTAYWIHSEVVPPEVPAARGYVEPIARNHRRAATVAHWLPQRFQIVGADQPASWGYQEQRHLRTLRASRNAYAVNAAFITPEIIRTGPLAQIYGSTSNLATIYGSDASVACVYGNQDKLNAVRGAT